MGKVGLSFFLEKVFFRFLVRVVCDSVFVVFLLLVREYRLRGWVNFFGVVVII